MNYRLFLPLYIDHTFLFSHMPHFFSYHLDNLKQYNVLTLEFRISSILIFFFLSIFVFVHAVFCLWVNYVNSVFVAYTLAGCTIKKKNKVKQNIYNC